MRPRWALLLAALALAPILPALRPGSVYGPFDTNVPHRPWATREDFGYRTQGGPLNDVTLQFVPWQTEARRQMLAGRVPLLNPHAGAGQPLLGNGQSAPFSLVSLLALPFDPREAQALRAFLKLLLALLGTFLAARQLGCGPASSLLAAVAYAFGGSLTVWRLFPHAEVMALFPFAFLGSERALADPGDARARVLLGLALGGMLLAGHPETAAAACLALAARWLFALRRAPRTVGVLVGVALLAALGTSFFTLPVAEGIFASEKFAREGGGRPGGAPPGLAVPVVANMAAPGLFGTPQRSGEAGPTRLQWLAEGSVGLPALVLALGGLLAWRFRGEAERFLVGLALAAFWIHLDPGGLLRPLFALPVLSAFATRYLAWLGGFAVALLAARALERADRRLFAGAAAAALLSAAAVAAVRPLESPVAAESARHILLAILVVLGVFGVLFLRRSQAVGLLAAALTLAQMTDAYGGYNPTVPAATAYPSIPLTEVLQREPGPFRVIGTRGVFSPNASAVYGLSDARTHDPMEPAGYVAWLADFLDLDVRTYKKQYGAPKRRHVPYLRLLGVRFLLAGPDIQPGPPWIDRGVFRETRLWELPGEVRWAFFPSEVLAASSAAEARALSASRPLRRAAIQGASSGRNGEARVLGVTVDGDRLRIETEVAEDAWLVVSQAALPGWRARADGEPARTAQADGALLAVHVPAGTRTVGLRYLPASWRVGLGLSAAAWLAAAVLMILVIRRSRR
jgi:hypothetical protein